MTVDEVFASFVKKEGAFMLHDHVVQVWWFAQLEDEDSILELIEDISQQYDDPAAAEIGFISLWNYIARG